MMLVEAPSARTQPATRPVPLWLDVGTQTFALYHEPAEPSHPLAVLFCAPLGWEDMSSYPVRRHWAQTLAAAGHPVLRVDLPGTGQSGGGPDDPGLVDTWVTATSAAAAWLRAHSGATAVAAIGINFGALLAVHAAAHGAPIDDLVLWGLPNNGRGLVRRMGAFAALQAGASADGDDRLPDGWLQTGGFAFSAETLADISRLRVEIPAAARVRRILLLGAAAPSATEDRAAELLRGSGAEITIADGSGYEELHDSPHLVPVPEATIATCGSWLAVERAASTRDPGVAPSSSDAARILHDGVVLRERPFEVQTPTGTMFGILTEPCQLGSGASDVALVLLPAMAERNIGPSRLWVDLARRHAARGLSTLRIDLLAIGDSDGDPERMRSLRTIYEPQRPEEVRGVLDALEASTSARRFALIGLCSGGYWAMGAASTDSRVERMLILNPSVPAEPKTVMMRAVMRHPLRMLSDPAVSRRFRHGGTATVLSGVRRELRRLAASGGRMSENRTVATPGESGTVLADLATEYQRLGGVLHRRGGHLSFGVGEFEAGAWLLKFAGMLGGSRGHLGVSLSVLKSADHNLRSITDQQAVHRLADQMLSEWELSGSARALDGLASRSPAATGP
jgi:dienelactone hydrolase